MDLRAHLLALVAPAKVGDELFPGARLLGASAELGLRLTFDLDGLDVHVEVEPLSASRPSAARSRRLMFSYRAGSPEARVPPAAGKALCAQVARVAAGREDEVLGAIAAEARSATEQRQGGARVRETRVERLLEAAGPRARRYYTLSPYVGCLIGCRFCYAQSRVGIARAMEGLGGTEGTEGTERTEGTAPAPWGSYVDVRVNAPEVLARELEELSPGPLKFCPIVSDPYQAVERRYRLTRRCLTTIRDAGRPWPTLVLTRSALLAEDAELLGSIPGGRGGVSIPTVDDAVRAHFEPRGASIPERLGLLRALRAAGAGTFAVVQPMLPGSLEGLADALAEAVSSVSVDVLRGVEGAGEDFAPAQFAGATDERWQRDRALALTAALEHRGVVVWRGELPPDLC